MAKHNHKEHAETETVGEALPAGQTVVAETAPAVSPTAEITIQGETFAIPQPFAEGHVLTAGEASALNQTYAENLRNNFAKTVKASKEAGTFEHAGAQAALAEYAASYAFGVRSSGTRTAVDPVEKKATDLASSIVKAKLTEKGIKMSALAEGQFDKAVAALLEKRPDIREEARRQVDMAKSIAASALDELTF